MWPCEHKLRGQSVWRLAAWRDRSIPAMTTQPERSQENGLYERAIYPAIADIGSATPHLAPTSHTKTLIE